MVTENRPESNAIKWKRNWKRMASQTQINVTGFCKLTFHNAWRIFYRTELPMLMPLQVCIFWNCIQPLGDERFKILDKKTNALLKTKLDENKVMEKDFKPKYVRILLPHRPCLMQYLKSEKVESKQHYRKNQSNTKYLEIFTPINIIGNQLLSICLLNKNGTLLGPL